MAETEKSCVICGGEEKDGELLIAAPCGRHWVCPDDISSFFERATQNESLFPPKCCGQMFMLQEYEEYVPFDVAWAYQVKEQGEYAILAKCRIYCGNPSCAKFLHPSTHVTDQATNITYAICEDGACGKLTCVGCKSPLDEGTQNHVCKKDENEEKFQKMATENGYQNCSQCGATVELAEACNHITCSCGYDFCYLCGKEWPGLHGCPHYGQATFDAEGYNQDGYHGDTSLNRAGLTRRQEMARRRGEDPDADGDNEGEEDDEEWDVMQHLTPDQRMAVNILHGPAREDALDNLRIQLFETQGITFGQDPPPPQILTERQMDIVDQIMQAIHIAADPLINPLLNRLRDEVLDAQITTQVFQRVAELYVQYITPELAKQLMQFIVQLNANQIFDLSRQLALRLNQQQAQGFVQHLSQHILAQQPTRPDGEGEGAAAQDLDEDSELDVDPEDDGNVHIDEDAIAPDELLSDNQSASDHNDMSGLLASDEGEKGAELALAEATHLHYQLDHQATVEDEHGDVSSSATEPERKTPTENATPVDKRPDIGLEAGARRLWGPPGGWPRSDDEEL